MKRNHMNNRVEGDHSQEEGWVSRTSKWGDGTRGNAGKQLDDCSRRWGERRMWFCSN